MFVYTVKVYRLTDPKSAVRDGLFTSHLLWKGRADGLFHSAWEVTAVSGSQPHGPQALVRGRHAPQTRLEGGVSDGSQACLPCAHFCCYYIVIYDEIITQLACYSLTGL